MERTPFPTVFEIIRFIAKHLDTKASNKKLDDLARDVIADYRKIPEMIQQVVGTHVGQRISPELARLMCEQITWLLDEYLTLVSMQSADGIRRDQIIECLVQSWFVPNAILAVNKILKPSLGLMPLSCLLDDEQCEIANALTWIEREFKESLWGGYLQGLPKEKRDEIAGWKRGKHVPSFQSISLLGLDDEQPESKHAWERIRSILLLARFISSIKANEPLGPLAINELEQQLQGIESAENPFSVFQSLQRASLDRVEVVRPHLEYIHRVLRLSSVKSASAKDESRKHLNVLTKKLKALNEYETSQHNVERLEGRWHVFAGDLKGACKHYGLAVESALYRAGGELEGILKEAFCVAAKAGDSVMLRNVKKIQILFKIDLESVNQQLMGKPRNNRDHFLQEWEMLVWVKAFDRCFPKECLFVGVPPFCEQPVEKPKLRDSIFSLRPNYRSLNKKVSVKEFGQKVWPQICCFILNEQFDVVRDLVEKGARMNVKSSSGDTPLIMALEKLVLMEIPFRSLDDRFYDLVISAPDVEKTVNQQTQKKKLTPLIQAVGAGRPDIVKKLLDMGAKVDLRGETDNQTALNICIKLIGIIKRPIEWVKIQRNHPITPELFDALRRHSNGMVGADLASQEAFFRNPWFWEMLDSYHKVVADRLVQHASLTNMREILRLLLEAGADTNATFQSPVKGYTPTMLVAELDLREELEMMLPYHADLNKTYTVPVIDYDENSWQIAKRCKSERVLQLMEDIQPYYTGNFSACAK